MRSCWLKKEVAEDDPTHLKHFDGARLNAVCVPSSDPRWPAKWEFKHDKQQVLRSPNDLSPLVYDPDVDAGVNECIRAHDPCGTSSHDEDIDMRHA
jgi:hypothetical protein